MWGRVWPRNGVVEASGFVVTDRDGKVRGSFAFDQNGVGLNLQDERGLWRAGFLVDNTGRPAMFLFDTVAQPVVTLNLQNSGAPSLRMRAPGNENTLQVRLGTGGAPGVFLTQRSGHGGAGDAGVGGDGGSSGAAGSGRSAKLA